MPPWSDGARRVDVEVAASLLDRGGWPRLARWRAAVHAGQRAVLWWAACWTVLGVAWALAGWVLPWSLLACLALAWGAYPAAAVALAVRVSRDGGRPQG